MKTKAIIADDESILRMFLSITLSAFGLAVECEAQTGIEAVAAVREYNPDVAFLDINMASKEDGLDACEAIKSEYPDTKVFFISAYPEIVFKDRLSAMSYDGYLVKPVNKDSLKSVLISNSLILPKPVR